MLVSFLARGNSKTSLLKFRDSRRGIKILAFPSPKPKLLNALSSKKHLMLVKLVLLSNLELWQLPKIFVLCFFFKKKKCCWWHQGRSSTNWFCKTKNLSEANNVIDFTFLVGRLQTILMGKQTKKNIVRNPFLRGLFSCGRKLSELIWWRQSQWWQRRCLWLNFTWHLCLKLKECSPHLFTVMFSIPSAEALRNETLQNRSINAILR